MVTRLAPSHAVYRAEINDLWPQRDKSSDGWIGDAAHAARVSDHNPDQFGIVRAFDTDEDLDGVRADGGGDAMVLAEALRVGRDPRIKYVIYEGRMFSSYAVGDPGHIIHPWTWRPYTGTNAHLHHLHLSILATMNAANDTRSWRLAELITHVIPEPSPHPTPQPGGTCTVNLRVLRFTMTGGDVISLQTLLNAKAGQGVRADGKFGDATLVAVKNVQRFFRLDQDGVVGSKTWGCLFL